MTYIGVSAGVGGGLFLFILISVFCVCRKIQEQKKTRGERYVGNVDLIFKFHSMIFYAERVGVHVTCTGSCLLSNIVLY